MSDFRRKWGEKRRHGGSMDMQIIFQFILSFLVFAGLMGVTGIVIWQICDNRIWYGTEFWYPILTWVKRHVFLLYTVLCLIASLLIACYYLIKPFLYLDAVIVASEQLAQLSEEPIVLPSAIRNIEDELNLVREQALRNAMLAKESEQRKNNLIVYLAHDLKTPLTSVIGYLTLLRDEPQISQPLQERYLSIALDKAERLEELINEFFDITRFNLTTLTLEPEQINLSRMLEQITSEFLPVLTEKELSWHMEIEPDVKCVCDPDKLQRVFDNLIRNAVNYSYRQTKLYLEMKTEGDIAHICVQNRGRTIPPEKLSHIFEQFFRVDTSRASATGGAGLGLAIAKEIVELHGGRILAQSENESIVFSVELPLYPK